jgi:hypothetical protein
MAWDKSAADAVLLVARDAKVDRWDDVAIELLELCDREVAKYPQQMVDALKHLVCVPLKSVPALKLICHIWQATF